MSTFGESPGVPQRSTETEYRREVPFWSLQVNGAAGKAEELLREALAFYTVTCGCSL